MEHIISGSFKLLHLLGSRSFVYLFIVCGLCACERDTYTSWNCNSPSEAKIPMVLRKAKMEFKKDKLDYCGSLGNQSYFDLKCPALINQSSATFTPSTGLLHSDGQSYQCVAL